MKQIMHETRTTLIVQVFPSSVLQCARRKKRRDSELQLDHVPDAQTAYRREYVRMIDAMKCEIQERLKGLEEIVNIFRLLPLEKFKTRSDNQLVRCDENPSAISDVVLGSASSTVQGFACYILRQLLTTAKWKGLNIRYI